MKKMSIGLRYFLLSNFYSTIVNYVGFGIVAFICYLVTPRDISSRSQLAIVISIVIGSYVSVIIPVMELPYWIFGENPTREKPKDISR